MTEFFHSFSHLAARFQTCFLTALTHLFDDENEESFSHVSLNGIAEQSLSYCP